METFMEKENISVYDFPIEVDGGEWIENHPDCDTVCEQIGAGAGLLVYAYATSKKGNEPLHVYRDKYLPDMNILKGISKEAVQGFILN